MTLDELKERLLESRGEWFFRGDGCGEACCDLIRHKTIRDSYGIAACPLSFVFGSADNVDAVNVAIENGMCVSDAYLAMVAADGCHFDGDASHDLRRWMINNLVKVQES